MADDQRPDSRASRLATGLAPVVLVVLVVVVVALVAVVVRQNARSTASPSVPVITATASAGSFRTGPHPRVRPALRPVTDAPGCATGRQGRAPTVLRVLQFNIHAGIDAGGEVALTRVAAEIEAADPDLVSLNEVDDDTRRSAGTDEASYLSRATGLQAVFGPTLLSYDGGRFGNAILSRYPVLASHSTPLPQVSGYEARALLTATVRVGHRTVSFSSLHLSAGATRGAPDRMLEAEAVAQIVRQARRPTIVAGDLNSPSDALPVRLLRAHLLDAQEQAGAGLGLTIPEEAPQARIDYVLYDNHFASVSGSTEVLPSAVSDHRSVVTELTLRPSGC